jgi:hypothetical protein
MEPYNYDAGIADGYKSAMDGYTLGLQLKDYEEAKAAKQYEAQLKAEQQQALNQDLSMVANNPTPDSIAKLSIKYPQLAEHFKHSYAMMDSAKKDAQIKTSVPIYAAIQNGEYGVALDKLEEQAIAYENVGDKEQAESTRAIAKSIEAHPEGAKMTLGIYLSGLMGADKFSSAFQTIQATQESADKSKPELDRVQAEAEIKNIEAENLPTEKALAMEKQTQDIETSKLDRKMKVLDAQIKKSNNETEIAKLELEREKTLTTLNQKKAESTQLAQTAMETTNQGLELINGLLKDKDSLKAVFGASAWKGMIPGTENRTVAGKIDQLSNILAMSNIDKLPGAMSDKDIVFLKSINANLDVWQDEEKGIAEIERIKKALERVQSKYINSGKLPEEGGAFLMQHPKLGNVDEGAINKILKSYPNQTREDVLEWLKFTGGQ